LEIADDEKFASAGRLMGYEENFLVMLGQEKKWRQAVQDWDNFLDWKKNRNPARAEMERKFGFDLKHAMHLVRLMTMCREVLTECLVLVRRPDAPFLKSVLNGELAFDYIEGWAEDQDKELIEVGRKSSLPRRPNLGKLDELCQQIIWTVEKAV